MRRTFRKRCGFSRNSCEASSPTPVSICGRSAAASCRPPRTRAKANSERTALAASRYGDAEQESDEQTREGCFTGDGADGGERLSRLPRGCDRFRKTVDRALKCCRYVSDHARYIGCGIDRTL